MDPVSVNATICLVGVLLLLIHIVNIILKKDKRKDEIALMNFCIFTMVHFITYFTFVLVKTVYTSDNFIMAFYTVFYIMNNIELLLFYVYFTVYAKIPGNKKKILDAINYPIFGIFVISDIVNIFTHMYFSPLDGNYVRAKFMILSQGYQFIMLVLLFVLVFFVKTLNLREKISFSLYCVLPFISILLQNTFKGYAIAYATLLIAIEILFLFLNVEKNIKLREEEERLKDANVKMMVSQIRPHFVYNTLSSISTLIPIEPNKAQKALDDFTDYLRMNFATLTETHLVPFEDELKHIQTYVSLEKMRFGDRLNVIYDIKASNFSVPPLTIQPLVENSIKHGILKKIDGGVVTIRTYTTGNYYYIEVSDDGVGFDANSIDFESNEHIGLNNVKYRITTMCHGDMKVESELNRGTKVVVRISK